MKILLMFLILLLPMSAFADPFIKSKVAPEEQHKIKAVTRIRLEINGTFESNLYQTNMDSNGIVYIDVQAWEGLKTIRAQIGNPWPGIPGVYKWGPLSAPLEYEFPHALSTLTELGIVSGNSN